MKFTSVTFLPLLSFCALVFHVSAQTTCMCSNEFTMCYYFTEGPGTEVPCEPDTCSLWRCDLEGLYTCDVSTDAALSIIVTGENICTADINPNAIQVKPSDSSLTKMVATATGSQELPTPNNSTAILDAKIDLIVSATTCQVNVYLQLISGAFEGPISAGHFHGPATASQTAGVLINLGLTATERTNLALGVLVAKSIPTSLANCDTVMQSQTYLNIHSSVYPGGEVRGQVVYP